MPGYNLLERNRLAGPEATLANYLQRAGQPEPNMLAGEPALPNVLPREMRSEPLGQSNLLSSFLQSFGRPSMDALQRGFEGKATPQEIARTFLETGPVGPFGMARARPSPGTFLNDLRSREVAGPNGVGLRWNPEQSWFDITRQGQPVGRTYVTVVDPRTGNSSERGSAFILGPRVDPEFQRQGIGSATYDTLAQAGEAHGMRLMPGTMLSQSAFDFWRKRDPDALLQAMSRRDVGMSQLSPEQKQWLSEQLTKSR